MRSTVTSKPYQSSPAFTSSSAASTPIVIAATRTDAGMTDGAAVPVGSGPAGAGVVGTPQA